MDLTFEHNGLDHQFLALADGAQVGVIDYRLNGTVATIHHTGTDPEHRGQGIAGQLTAVVLDEARAQGWSVVPQCPYAAHFIEEHPEYAGLVEGGASEPA